MKTQSITLSQNLSVNARLAQKKNIDNSNIESSSVYNPISYRPISFGARLFRTPENFYEQQFNMDGMPDTMRKYLMNDFSDRRHMPPSQMMALVFDDINLAKDVEQAKRLYPDEPLFKNLKNPSGKARTNIVAGLQILQDGTNTEKLFKNGDNDLGIYILKKIYIEGKTLKEINNDFKSDATPIYRDLLPEINYQTLDKYGIKFPNQGFWHSFYSNRESFPYTYTPRKGIAGHSSNQTGGTIVRNPVESRVSEEKRKYTIGTKEKEKISDSIIKGEGNPLNTKRALRNCNVDKENCNFLFKYMSPIMSVSADRINLSERLEEFYRTNGYGEIAGADLSNLTHKQGAALKEFWKLNPALREHFSNAIKDTLELFTEEYGENGENIRFKELLKFAESIKPEREFLKSEHFEKQKYYEEIFKPITEEATPVGNSFEDDIAKELAEVENRLKQLKKYTENPELLWEEFKPKTWTALIDRCIDYKYAPETFTNIYKKFFLRSDYIKEGDAVMAVDPDIRTNPKLKELIYKISTESRIKYLHHDIAAKLAMCKIYGSVMGDYSEYLYTDIADIDNKLAEKFENKCPNEELRNKTNEIYRHFMSEGKSSRKEMDKPVNEFIKLIFGYGLPNSQVDVSMDSQTVKNAMKNARDQIMYSGLYKEYENVIKVALDERTDKKIVKFICDAMLTVLKEMKK